MLDDQIHKDEKDDPRAYEDQLFKINPFSDILLYHDLYLYEELFLKNFFFNEIINFDEINYYIYENFDEKTLYKQELAFVVKNNNLFFFYENKFNVFNINLNLATNNNNLLTNYEKLITIKPMSQQNKPFNLLYYNAINQKSDFKYLQNSTNQQLQNKNFVKSSKNLIKNICLSLIDLVTGYLNNSFFNIALLQKDFFYDKNNIWKNGIISWSEFLESRFLIQENGRYLENFKKKIYKLIIFELEREKFFFLKKYKISEHSIKNKQILYFPLLQQKKIPPWLYNSTFYKYEILKRYNTIIQYLYKTLILQQDFFFTNNTFSHSFDTHSLEGSFVLLKNEFYNLLWYDSINNVISIINSNTKNSQNFDLLLRTSVNFNLILSDLNANIDKIENIEKKQYLKFFILYPYLQYKALDLQVLPLYKKLLNYKFFFYELQKTLCFDFELFCQQKFLLNIEKPSPYLMLSYYFNKYPFLPYYIQNNSKNYLLNFLKFLNKYEYSFNNIFQQGVIQNTNYYNEKAIFGLHTYYFEFFLLYFFKQIRENEKYFLDFTEYTTNEFIIKFTSQCININSLNFSNVYNSTNKYYNNSIWDIMIRYKELEGKLGVDLYTDFNEKYAKLHLFFDHENFLLTLVQESFLFPQYFETTFINDVDLDYDLYSSISWI
jgi:hypothetical protein